MTTPPEAETAPLSTRFHEETRVAHERAENSPFMSQLLGGELDIAAWVMLLDQLEHVYAAIDGAAATLRAQLDVPDLLPAALERGDAIAADLAALRERTGLEPLDVLPETASYVAAIEASADELGRLVAHHYTRYLGDLSGGQAIRVMLDRHYGLPDDEAAFFRFEGIGKFPTFKNTYRAALDGLNLDAPSAQRAVDETSVAFDANERLFEGVRRAHAERG